MNPAKSRSVHRYFEPADTFVQILVCDPSVLDIEVRPGLNRAQYRKLVVQACCPEFKSELRAKVEKLLPDDPLLAEDLLYQLCIEVNPALDIHTVRLRGETFHEAASESAPSTHVQPSERADDYLDKLKKRARGLEERLKRKIVGQDAAIEVLARAVEKAAAGLAHPGRPLGTFLFVGRTGTGKTELTKALAHELCADSKYKGLVRVDCAEFALAHEYSKLIGAPPGYIGHEDGGQLTEQLTKHPESVVLFDEIEKAHPRMHNLLLSILEDGVLTDSKGKSVSFERAMIVMTSNAGAFEMQSARRTVGFERENRLNTRQLFEIVHESLKTQFAPEFLGRIDETILFGDLSPSSAQQIAQRQLADLAARARKRGMRVAFTPAVSRWIASKGYTLEAGARELRRVIQREVEGPLARMVVTQSVPKTALVRTRIHEDKPAFEIER